MIYRKKGKLIFYVYSFYPYCYRLEVLAYQLRVVKMASKALVKLPTMPFPQGKKSATDIVTLSDRHEKNDKNGRHEGVNLTHQQGTNVDRVLQLEQNMKFLQEQHQITLIALHHEVELLRQKNRDLQFQLFFSKASACVPSSLSSPEDNGTGFAKSKDSPVCVNVTPLQVELLEKDLQDTKAALQEAKTQNEYLSEIIEQQKKKLDLSEENKKKLLTADVAVQVGGKLNSVGADSVVYLKAAETMVNRLRRQNEEQRKEIASLSHCINKAGQSRSNNGQHNRRSPTSTQDQTSHKFPPLQSQSFWHREVPRNGRSRYDKQQQDRHTESDSTVLPQLQSGNGKMDTVILESPFYNYWQYHNYCRTESYRKYKGQMSQRDRRDGDQH